MHPTPGATPWTLGATSQATEEACAAQLESSPPLATTRKATHTARRLSTARNQLTNQFKKTEVRMSLVVLVVRSPTAGAGDMGSILLQSS